MGNAEKLLILKLLHTLVWIFFVSVIFYVVYSGLLNRITLYTWIAIGLIIGEGIILLFFKMICPLTLMARKYSASEKANFDIFLPEWLAKYNKEIFTSVFIAGVALVLMRYFNIF